MLAPLELLDISTTTSTDTATATPTCWATGVQRPASTPGVSIDTTRAYRAPFSLRSRFPRPRTLGDLETIGSSGATVGEAEAI